MPRNPTDDKSTFPIRQQEIAWANVILGVCPHMASPGHIELTHGRQEKWAPFCRRPFQMDFF